MLMVDLQDNRATGSQVVGPKQTRAQLEANDKNSNEVYDEFNVPDEANNDVSSYSRIALNSMSKQSEERKKKKTRIVDLVSEEIKYLKEGLDVVAAALDCGNVSNIAEEDLFEKIEKVGGISAISRMKVDQALIKDMSTTHAFLACPADRKKLWLIVNFDSLLFDII
ncbi:hypothetical protein M9H77_29799 [Catharanthus roseus]|uniref:Uncharacterized protein n=1 Tax=Catharanthus roseus TaxID=4058 RepID=A0ACB9ZWR3_CATRO|nr:hypothetical protein M9H77_29799 [Catharanthus roseus]